MDEDHSWFDELIRDAEAKQLKNENPYVLQLIRVLWPFGERGLARRHVIERVWRLRNEIGVAMPKAFGATVQSAYNHHCEHSDVFVARNVSLDEALFYPVGRKGSGQWAINRNRAETWLRRKSLGLSSN
jgi:hypothetical protein